MEISNSADGLWFAMAMAAIIISITVLITVYGLHKGSELISYLLERGKNKK